MTDLIETLNGAILSSVAFIHDYVKLDFDGATLTINARFVVQTANAEFARNEPGFCDALCSQIGQKITRAGTESDRVLLLFDGGVQLSISLLPDDQVSPEAAVLRDDSGRVVVW